MSWRAQIDDRGVIARYKDLESGEVISAKEYERRQQMQQGQLLVTPSMQTPQLTATPAGSGSVMAQPAATNQHAAANDGGAVSQQAPAGIIPAAPAPDTNMVAGGAAQVAPAPASSGPNPLIQPGAQLLNGGNTSAAPSDAALPASTGAGQPPTMNQSIQGKNLRMEGVQGHINSTSFGYRAHGFLDATSIAILLPTLVLLALIIAAAHKKRLFPWQTLRTFSPPSGLLSPREYERSYLCPPNLRRHGRMGKRNPDASWTDQDGIVIPFGFLARTHLPVTIPLGRLPNKNIFMVAPSGSGKTTLMRAIIKAMLAKPCVIIALEAKANDPNLDERREGFKYTVLPEAQSAGFKTLYFNPLDSESIHWNPLDLDPITFASSIVQDVNSLPPEEQHWAERDHGYISGLATLLKWGAVMVAGEDENGTASEILPLPCNPRGLMRLVNNRRNIVESLRRLKSNANVDAADLNELTQMLSSIIRTDTDWDKNIQGIRGRLRMFKNPNVLRVTDKSNIDMRGSMYEPTVLIFGAPASLGPDAESLASCFVYQLQQALHTRYGTANILPLFAFFDEYQTLNMDIAGRLSAIVRGANGGLAVILQNISQITGKAATGDPTSSGASELKTIFSNSAVRICLHNADESTARFFSEEIGKHAIIVPGISDHYEAKGFGIFPSTWNRIHSQQVVARVDPDSIKRMEKYHALVYLSPAGDAEFAEVKPLMVDFRGIEEIARLHLLHNVSGRHIPPGVPPEAGGHGSGIPGAPGSTQRQFQLPPGVAGSSHLGATGATQLAPAASVAPITSTTAMPPVQPAQAERPCPHCGQAAGKGRFCIECGKPIASEEIAAVEVAMSTLETANQMPAQMLPAEGSPEHASSAPAAASNYMTGQTLPPHPSYLSEQAAQIAGTQSAPRPAMSDQFGAAMPQGFVTTTLPTAVAPTVSPGHSQQLPAAQDQADQAARAGQRQPLTSLSPDLARLGLPQAAQPAPTEPPPGLGTQRERRSGGGVEF